MAGSFIITASNIIALWQLIIISSKYEGITIDAAINIARTSGLAGGNVPADEGLKLGRSCKLLEIENKKLSASQYCKDNLLPCCETDEPNIFIIRSILYRYVSYQNLDWLLFFNEDPEIFKSSIPSEWIELLDYALLFNFEEPLVREWWAGIFSRFQTYKEGKKLEYGKVAEKLTFDHEKQRLQADGLESDHTFVKWASQINDKYGYDVLSIRGSFLKFRFAEKDKIEIEVKSSVSSSKEEFRFFVSKPEWIAAEKNISSYYFYCWISTSLEKQSAVGPFIIPAVALKPLIPTDNANPICEWSECRFVLNLSYYQIN